MGKHHSHINDYFDDDKENTESGLKLSVAIAFDFITNSTFGENGRGLIIGEVPTLGVGSVSNFQYDADSDSLTYFDNGKIFSVRIRRGRTVTN